MSHRLVILAAIVALVSVQSARAADPAISCQSGKLKAAGKYTLCLLRADSKGVETGFHSGYTKCDENIAKIWSSVEAKGAGMCPGGAGDQADIQAYLEGCRGSVAGALATGDTLPVPGAVSRTFTDNGNGTITDDVTGLTWEKLSDDESIHDKDNQYSFYEAATLKVAALNTANFAGHNDWRVPDRFELETLVNLAPGNPSTYAAFNSSCTSGCTVTTCSCTSSGWHRSSNAYAELVTGAWCVGFYDGAVFLCNKDDPSHVRAVRGGS